MTKYVLRRLIIIIPTVLGIIFIVFSIMNLTPGEPARMILGTSATQEQVDQLRDELGLNQPFLTRFFEYIRNLFLNGDFGKSYRTRQPFATEMFSRLPYTLRIGFISMALASIIGISLGVYSAVRQYSVVDTFITSLALSFMSIPGFWMGMLCIYFFSLKLGWLPTSGIASWQAYILPIGITVLRGCAAGMRLTRTIMLDAIRQDYNRTAYAKGCTEKRVIFKHALKNAMIPIIAYLGIEFGRILGGTVITETVFSIPGVGTYMLAGILSKDIPVVMGCAVILSSFFCLTMVVTDILYAVVDPRIRTKYSQ